MRLGKGGSSGGLDQEGRGCYTAGGLQRLGRADAVRFLGRRNLNARQGNENATMLSQQALAETLLIVTGALLC